MERLHPRVQRLARTFLRNPADADDASQAAMLEILRAASAFRGESRLESWADRIAVRTAIRMARTRRLAAVRSADGCEPDELPGAGGETRDDELPRPLLAYLDALPEARRTVLVLRHVVGCSVQEIAEPTGVSTNTVKDRLLTARHEVRKMVRRDLAVRGASARWMRARANGRGARGDRELSAQPCGEPAGELAAPARGGPRSGLMGLARAAASFRLRALARASTLACWVRLSGVGLALAAIGCSLEPDVVARRETPWVADAAVTPSADAAVALSHAVPVDAGAEVQSDQGSAPQEEVASPRPDDARCASVFDRAVLATTMGRLYGYDPTRRAVPDYGVPTCLQTNGSVLSATVDRQGKIWVSWAPDALYAIEPGSLRCVPLSPSARLDAMAFTHAAQDSTLYALENGELVAIDPDSLEVAVIGELRATHLVADPYGSLFAVTQDEQGTVHIDAVDLGDASVRPAWTTWLPQSGLTGVAYLDQEGFWLFSQTTLYQFDWRLAELKVIGPVTDVELGIATVAAPSCDPIHKFRPSVRAAAPASTRCRLSSRVLARTTVEGACWLTGVPW